MKKKIIISSDLIILLHAHNFFKYILIENIKVVYKIKLKKKTFN